LVCPWLSARTLEQADAEILLDLLNHCHQAGRELGIGRFAWIRQGFGLLLVALAVAAVGGLSAWVLNLFWAPVEDGWRTLSYSFKHMSALQQVSLGGGVIILFAMYLLSRTART
jgi:hypothetical protein